MSNDLFDVTNWIRSFPGGIHFITSVIGLLTGAYILFAKKGTALHKKLGYVFAVSLVVVNISALFIYDFNDGAFSVFHALVPVSLFFLIFGMVPFMGKKTPRTLKNHIIGMNGAAIGLWAAGATEYFIRELSSGLSQNESMAYSFAISVPFAILITISITVNLKKVKS